MYGNVISINCRSFVSDCLIYFSCVCVCVCRSSRRAGEGVALLHRSCSATPSPRPSCREQTLSRGKTLATSPSVRQANPTSAVEKAFFSLPVCLYPLYFLLLLLSACLYLHPFPPLPFSLSLSSLSLSLSLCSLVLFPRSFKDEAAADKTVNLIHTFRDYLHYHIKCSKAYLHCRMRVRTAALLKILNRARPEIKTTEKKTIS